MDHEVEICPYVVNSSRIVAEFPVLLGDLLRCLSAVEWLALHVSGLELDDNAMAIISEAVASLPSLRGALLDLGTNDISDAGIELFCKAIQLRPSSSRLEVLSLKLCGTHRVTDNGMAMLQQHLPSMRIPSVSQCFCQTGASECPSRKSNQRADAQADSCVLELSQL